MLLTLLTLCSATALSSAQRVQPAPDAPPLKDAAQLTAAAVLQQLRETYRAGPLADKVEMSASVKNDSAVRGPAGIRSVATARLDASGSEPSLRLDLSDLVLHASPKELHAINRNEDRTFALIPLTGLTQQALEEHLPPIPLPQVALAFGDPESNLIKGLGKIQWDTPTLTAAGPARIIRLSGTHASGKITLTIDGATWRLMQVNAEIQRPAGHTQLLLDITPVDPGAPDTWRIDTKGRDQVTSLAQLKPREGQIRIGQKLPNISGNSPNYGPWSLVEAFGEDRRATPADAKPAAAMVLIIFRNTEDAARSAATLRDARAARTAIAKVLTDLKGESITALCESLVVFGGKEFDRESPGRLQQEWGKDAPADAPARELRWSLNTATTIDRISPASGCVAAVILPDLTLAGTVPLDNRSGDAAVANDIANLVRAAARK